MTDINHHIAELETESIIPRWLNIGQAVAYCPYGRKKLIQLIKDRVIKGGQLKDNKGAWFVDRYSLDEHLNSQCRKPSRIQSPEVQKKLVDFAERLNI